MAGRGFLDVARDLNLKAIGDALDGLVQQRNLASYELTSTAFSSATVAQDVIDDATGGLAILDQIEADPGRRAAAIAALPP